MQVLKKQMRLFGVKPVNGDSHPRPDEHQFRYSEDDHNRSSDRKENSKHAKRVAPLSLMFLSAIAPVNRAHLVPVPANVMIASIALPTTHNGRKKLKVLPAKRTS
jgi:hypothetical protein